MPKHSQSKSMPSQQNRNSQNICTCSRVPILTSFLNLSETKKWVEYTEEMNTGQHRASKTPPKRTLLWVHFHFPQCPIALPFLKPWNWISNVHCHWYKRSRPNINAKNKCQTHSKRKISSSYCSKEVSQELSSALNIITHTHRLQLYLKRDYLCTCSGNASVYITHLCTLCTSG